MELRELTAAAMAFVLVWTAGMTHAGPLLVAGSPEYDQATNTGLSDGRMAHAPGWGVNNSGTAVGYAYKFVDNYNLGNRAARWDALGTAATELGILETDYTGATAAQAYAVNDYGIAVGYARRYVGGISVGDRAVRWDASGTAPVELGNLGTTGAYGYTESYAYAVNASGTAVGWADKYVGDTSKGHRAVRWDASGTATELGNLGTDYNGYSHALALAVNDSGTAVGYAEKYTGGISGLGVRAVRWDASGTTATELGNLGTSTQGTTSVYALAVNDSGTAVGYARKYVSRSYKGDRAVRWDASGTAATELDNLGTGTDGKTDAEAVAVNASGTSAGYAYKFSDGHNLGYRAVRWDASSAAATELGVLGTDAGGGTYAKAYAVNDVGTAVGSASKYIGGSSVGERAVLWLPDASAVDLNDLGIAPIVGNGSWTLTSAKALSPDGWVAGEGMFLPDGPGPVWSYGRLWVAQVGLGGNWTAGDGVWGRGPNWSTGTPAMQVGDATFNLPDSYTVSLDRDETTKTITISAGQVTLQANGHTLATENGTTIAVDATLKPAGTLSITGDLASSGSLEFEIASLTVYDHLDLGGTLSAGGTIAVGLLNGYSPAYGDTFDLLDFGVFVDSGYAIDLATLPAGLSWDTSALATTGNISVVPEPSMFVLLICGAIAGLICWRQAS